MESYFLGVGNHNILLSLASVAVEKLPFNLNDTHFKEFLKLVTFKIDQGRTQDHLLTWRKLPA